MSVAANAADVGARPAPYAPPPPVYAPPPFSWTGFYIGGNIGGAWANRDVRDPFLGVDFNNGNSNGAFIGGGQLGYNWQIGPFQLERLRLRLLIGEASRESQKPCC